MTVKEISEHAESIGSIDNAAELREALPFIVESARRLKDWAKTQKRVMKIIEALGEKAAKYALEHPTCFDTALSVSPLGVQSGDITIDGTVYHLAAGFGAIIREDGEYLTQDFLSGLPSDWTVARLSLDTQGIERKYGKGEKLVEELADRGLVRSAKNVWGIKVEAATVEGCDD